VLIANDNLQIDIGRCPNCGDYGPIGTYCTECEDSGMIHDDFNPMGSTDNEDTEREENNNNEKND
jgi:hypothetical protein